MAFLCTTFLLFASTAAANPQTVGGGYDLIYDLKDSLGTRQFGCAVSGAGDLNGDGYEDFLVADKKSDAGGIWWSGFVHAYSGLDGSVLLAWRGQSAYELFGESLSGAGDINGDGIPDVVIGSPGGVFGATTPGSAAAYSGFDGSLLYRWDGSIGDWFGFSVSNAGDVNGDGFDDVMFSAPEVDPGIGLKTGIVYLHSGADGSLLFQWNGQNHYGEFGYTLSSAGDFNADGVPDILVGEIYADPGGKKDAGSAYVFSGSDGSQLFQANGQYRSDNLGIAVANSGDINRDGFDDLLVSARYLPPSSSNPHAGTVYLYSGVTGTMLQQWIGTDAYDGLGSSVSGAGDVNGDGWKDLIFGAPGTAATAISGVGSAYLYSFNPILSTSATSISAAAGGVLLFGLDFPEPASFQDYKVLISAAGTGPTHYGIDIPLTVDSYAMDSFNGVYPVPNHSAMHGVLDVDGDASASLTVPAGIPSSLIGNTYFFAAIANPTSAPPEFSSIAVAVSIEP
jgi:hypothetical protein